MILKVTNTNSGNISYVSGDENMCLANVGEDEVYEEVDYIPALNPYTDAQMTKISIVAARDRALQQGFTYPGDGREYPCDPVFQGAIKTYITRYTVGMLTPTDTVRIRRNDNSFYYPNYAELIPFAAALMSHVNNIWTDYWAAKDAL